MPAGGGGVALWPCTRAKETRYSDSFIGFVYSQLVKMKCITWHEARATAAVQVVDEHIRLMNS